jgi:hypothetical protein
MKSEKSSSMLPDIFSIVGILFSAVFCFIALVHTLNGDLWVSAFVSLVLIIVLYKLPERLMYFKSRKIRRQINRSDEDRWQEKALLGIYVVVAIPIFVLTTHFVFVEFANKNRIKQEGLGKWLEISKMENAYQREVSKKINVMETNADALYSTYSGGAGESRKNALDSLKSLLSLPAGTSSLSSADFDQAKKTKKTSTSSAFSLSAFKESNQYDKKLKEADAAIKNWNFMKVGYYYKEADKLSADLLSAAKSKMPSFEYATTSGTNVYINSPMESLKQGGILVLIISLIVSILVNLCVLANYLSADRAELRLQGVNPTDAPGGIRI